MAGRPKGSGNKTPEAKAFVRRVENLLAKGDPTMRGGLERLACRLLTAAHTVGDLKTAKDIWRTLLNYKLGMPTQPLEHSGTIGYTEALTKMRAKRGQ
jgi:hypothetical protein